MDILLSYLATSSSERQRLARLPSPHDTISQHRFTLFTVFPLSPRKYRTIFFVRDKASKPTLVLRFSPNVFGGASNRSPSPYVANRRSALLFLSFLASPKRKHLMILLSTLHVKFRRSLNN